VADAMIKAQLLGQRTQQGSLLFQTLRQAVIVVRTAPSPWSLSGAPWWWESTGLLHRLGRRGLGDCHDLSLQSQELQRQLCNAVS
jgi:hypothetical protein